MNENVHLGSIGGVEVGVNWSVLLVFALFAWELSDLVLPSYHRGQSTAVYWIVGVAVTIVFFASLLAHEVSHALVARHEGVGVRRITLWLFGGVSELEGEALTPQADFRIAVVGPLTSLVLAVVFGACAVFVHQGDNAMGVVISGVGWLAWMNLLLGAFNLLPGAPLDGGRVLRALVWRRSGDRLRGVTVASRSGQVLGFVLIALGVLEFLAGYLLGLWLLFLGWFLLAAARSEESSAVMRNSLSHVRVRDLMTGHPVTFDSQVSVADFINHQLHQHHFNSYPLTGANGQVEGLCTMARLRRVRLGDRATTRLIDVAAPLAEVPRATPDEPVADLFGRMQASRDGRALVFDDAGQLVGIVSPSDIARYVQLCMLQSQGRSAKTR